MLDAPGTDLLCTSLVSESYVQHGLREIYARNKLAKDLLSRRKLPKTGWDEISIDRFFADIACMDSSNFSSNAGVGEREARVACPAVARRNMHMAHGIGRSGDIAAEQPKAAGSTLMARVCHILVLDALKSAGLPELDTVQVLPLATGMTMTMTLLSCHAHRSKSNPGCKYAIWSRIDQKTCLKAIASANLTPIVIDPILVGDELQTDIPAIHAKLLELGPENMACIITTTSCFAPRACDDVEAVARICDKADVPHVINNAYGVQSEFICKEVTRACRVGRVDAVIQSTDKNFMVPVGGAILAAPKQGSWLVNAVSKGYPGRASASAHIDLTMTLLYWGLSGWKRALAEREDLFLYLKESAAAAAAAHGERVLVTPRNPFSIGITLTTLTPRQPTASTDHSRIHPLQAGNDAAKKQVDAPSQSQQHTDKESTTALVLSSVNVDTTEPSTNLVLGPDGCVSSTTIKADVRTPSVTFFGSMMWQRCVSGVRVIARGKSQVVAGIKFEGYGSSCNDYSCDYFTAAAAIGATREDVDSFIARMHRCLTEFKKRAELN